MQNHHGMKGTPPPLAPQQLFKLLYWLNFVPSAAPYTHWPLVICSSVPVKDAEGAGCSQKLHLSMRGGSRPPTKTNGFDPAKVVVLLKGC